MARGALPTQREKTPSFLIPPAERPASPINNMKHYNVSLRINQTIPANNEEEVLAIFSDDLIKAWDEGKLANITEVKIESWQE